MCFLLSRDTFGSCLAPSAPLDSGRDLFAHGGGRAGCELLRFRWRATDYPHLSMPCTMDSTEERSLSCSSADKSDLLQLPTVPPGNYRALTNAILHVSDSEYRHHNFHASLRDNPALLGQGLIYTHPGSQSAPTCPNAECLHSSLAPSTETTPSLPTVTSVFASAPHFKATPGALVRRGSDHALEVLRYCCTVTPVAPTVARNCPV